MPKRHGRAYTGGTFGRRIMTINERRAASEKIHGLRVVYNLKKAFRRHTQDQIAEIAKLLINAGKKATAKFKVGFPTEVYEIAAMEIAPLWFQKHNVVLSRKGVLYLKMHSIRASKFPRCCLSEVDAASLHNNQKKPQRVAKSDVQCGRNRARAV